MTVRADVLAIGTMCSPLLSMASFQVARVITSATLFNLAFYLLISTAYCPFIQYACQHVEAAF